MVESYREAAVKQANFENRRDREPEEPRDIEGKWRRMRGDYDDE